jgi:hypothetical protein
VARAMSPIRTARDIFTVGQRVTLSEEGRARFGTRGGAREGLVTGVVVGFGRGNKAIVRVRRDGNTTPTGYHMAFWTGVAE